MYNKVILMGYLCKNIDFNTYGDTEVAKTSLAVNRKTTKGEETCFIDIVFFKQLAKIALDYLAKGSLILVEGRLKFDTYETQQGEKRQKHSVIVESLKMVNSKNKEPQKSNKESTANDNHYKESTANNYDDYYNENIPF